ncbi:MAG: DMT family transporter [Anaerosomatales bacterium]|nr:DMT family transporter [Anaerosomatales bacterium]
MTDGARRFWVSIALVGVAMVWGATFVVVKDAVEAYPLYAFLGWRFAVAIVAFVALFPRAVFRLNRRTLGAGVLAGLMLTAGYVFQTWGLQDTSASKAAFITGMFVVITPLMQAFLLRRVPRMWTMAGVVFAVTGLWLLSGTAGGGWNVGDTRTLICAAAYSAHMIVLGSIGREHDVSALTLVQLVTVAVLCGGVSLFAEQAPLPTGGSLIVALLVTGVLGSAAAFLIQTYAQRFLSPTRTALILISEPAFGGLFGWLAGEVLGVRGLAGAGLILAGMLVAELAGVRAAREAQLVLEPSIEGPPVVLVEEDAVSAETDARDATVDR